MAETEISTKEQEVKFASGSSSRSFYYANRYYCSIDK